MSHFVKYKRFVFLLAMLWLSTSASAQEARSSAVSSFKQFIIENTGNRDSSEYFICIPKASVRQFRRQSSVTIERQLTDSVFIFSYKQSPTPPAFNFAYNWVQKANADWKMSPSLLLQKNKQAALWPGMFIFSVRNLDHFINSNRRPEKLQKTSSSNTFITRIDNANDFNELLNDRQVFFLSLYHQSPIEELQINDLDLSANRINLLHSREPSLDGNGINISIKEKSPDAADIDYAARYIPTPLASPTITDHATVMATMMAGAGNSWYLGKGVAPGASLSSSNFANLLPDADSSYGQYHVSVQNHSYGVGIENFYGADAAAFDSGALRNDSLLFIFSAGNSGTLTATAGNYAGMPARDNLTGSFKMAKNIITVGAVDSFGRVAASSSRGPAFDGRVKPEMVAYGEDGSSGAAALVSGTAAVLQQVYKKAKGNLPPSGLVKAILVNSARDVGTPGIDYISGYGNLDANQAVKNLSKAQYFSGEATDQSEQTFALDIPAQAGKIKITLVWQDAPGEANAYRALVNDLDLELQSASGQTWKPWVLNSLPQADSLDALPIRRRDSLNNVEQITLDHPATGRYRILVRGFSVISPTQPFFIAYQVDTVNYFSWDFPAPADNIFPAATNLVRFSTDIATENARLLYSIDQGNSWRLIDSLVNTTQPYLYWNAPDTNAPGLLKLEAAGRQFISDTFTISRKPDFKLGFNCEDSLLWYWNKLPGIGTYQLYAMGDRSLQPVAITTDTQFIFNKKALNARYFAVAPIIGSKIGVKSYTTDYTTQGVDCYISNFIADLVNEQANVQLQLGTDYLVKTIQFEKWKENEFVTLQPAAAISGLNYQAVDNQLHKGSNIYRAKVTLSGGRIIYTEPASLFYFDRDEVVIYPNPISQNSQLNIQFRELLNQWVNICDISGRTVFSRQMNATSEKIPFNFPSGMYLVIITIPGTYQKRIFKLITY